MALAELTATPRTAGARQGADAKASRLDQMRILHVIAGIDPTNGGPAIVVAGLAPAQAQAGMTVSVVATFAAGTDVTPADRLREQGIAVQMVGPCGGLFFSHPQLKAILAEQIAKADVVHIHAAWEDIQYQAARIARAKGVPYVITPHGMITAWSLSHNRLLKMAYLWLRARRNLNSAALLHFATELERQSVARLGLKAPTLVEPLGMDLSELEHLPPPGAFRQRYPALAGRRYVAYLGRIHALKGLEILVPALAESKLKDVALVIGGPDCNGFRQTIEQMVRDHGLTDRVIFTGMLHGVDRLAMLVDAALLALPSFHENFGLSVIEALACGIPVIVSDRVCLYPDILQGQVGGVVPTEVPALAAELARWMRDDALRQAAAQRAKPFAWSRYDLRVVARHWAEHYRKIAR